MLPVLRKNMGVWVIFKFADYQSVVKQIYPEISEITKQSDFIQLY